VSGTIIIKEMALKGIDLNSQNISTHRGKHLVAEVDVLVEKVRQELRQRAAVEQPPRAALLLVMDKALKDLPHARTSIEQVIKAIDLLEKLEGGDTDRALMVAYMERAFANQDRGPELPPAGPATVVRQLAAS
jgi:hypothetical protein